VPTYAYACTNCDNRFEVQQSFSDAALTECPQCQGRLRKLFNSVGIVFKGSGFYRTDSRGKPAKTETAAADKGDKKPAAESTSSSSEKSEKKAPQPKAAEKSA